MKIRLNPYRWIFGGLTIVVGKKGSGKTAFALGLIEEELIRGKRIVVTNLQIYKDKLEAYLRAKGHEVNVADRLIVLPPKDKRFARWWRIRGGEKDLGAFGIDPAWDTCEGILFVVDEGQHHYSARGWSERHNGKREDNEPSLGEESQDYLCQERKTGDDTIVTTPSSTLLDKNFRTLSTECVVMDNWYKKRIRGIKPPGRFDVSIFENCPPGPGEEPTARKHFHLDATGLMGCYNTAAGAGFIGSRADMDSKPTGGIPLWTVIASVFALGVVCVLCVHFGLKGVLGHFGKKLAKDDVAIAAAGSGVVQNKGTNGLYFTNSPAVGVSLAGDTKTMRRRPEVVEKEIYALSRGTAGWGVRWADGFSSLASDVFPLGHNRYSVDGELCRLVRGIVIETNLPVYRPGGSGLRRAGVSDVDPVLDTLAPLPSSLKAMRRPLGQP